MERITDRIWGVSSQLVLPGGVTFPLRMTVVALPDGELWLHSPVSIDDAVAERIESLGTVRHLVAPTRMHHKFMQAAQQRWPEALTWAVPGWREDHAPVPVDHVVGEPAPWSEVLETTRIDGAPSLEEHVFFHRPSRSLLVSDLVFNFRGTNLATRLMLMIVGCSRGIAASRSWNWFFAKDRAAVAASVHRILEWDIQRVIPCHGDIVTESAHTAFMKAVARLIDGQSTNTSSLG